MQFGDTVQLELFDFSGLNGKQRSFSIGLGDLESAGGLFDVITDLPGDGFQHIRRLHARIEDHCGHHESDDHCGRSQEAPETIDRERHLGSV